MSIEGHGHFFAIYFPGFVCFVLYKVKISGERLQDQWSSGLIFGSKCTEVITINYELCHEKTCFLAHAKTKGKLSCTATQADQRLCFHFIDGTMPLHPKSEISKPL